MPKVSIIVPVYNTEKYLTRCIDSILAQTFTDFELILVNDGSKDNSGKICDEYAQKDSRIVVIHKDNGGVSSARNRGIDMAHGEWITFVDSDDWIYPNFISSFEFDADLFICGIERNGGQIHTPKQNERLTKNDIAKFCIEEASKSFLNGPCAKIYNINIIKNNTISFNSKLHIGEDTDFVYQVLCYCNSVQLCNTASYYYDIDLTNYKNKYKLDPLQYYIHATTLTNSINSLEKSLNAKLPALRNRIYNVYLSLFYYYIGLLPKADANKELREYNRLKLYQFCGKLNWKEYLYLRCITMFPSLFYRR